MAVLWPHARGQLYYVPMAFADVMDVLTAVEQEHRIDPRRVYLTGDCEGAAFAIGLAESYPDRFAALGVMNAMTAGPRLPTRYWDLAHSLFALSGNLSNMPVQLLHGKLFPHSPLVQSERFADALKANGADAKLVRLEGDARWDDDDPFRLSFDFFRGKATPEVPEKVSFTTAQLKQDSAYWVRVKGLMDAGNAGTVTAEFQAPDEIEATTENVSELELRPDRLGLRPGRLSLTVNGLMREVPVDGMGPISIPIDVPETQAKLSKTHQMEGPVADAFTGPFLLIENTLGEEAERSRQNKLVDTLAKGWEESLYVPCRRKRDRDVTDGDIHDYNLVIVGTRSTNALLKRMGDQLPLAMEPGRIRIGGATYEGSGGVGIAFVYPNPLNPKRYVVVMTSNNFTDFTMPARNLGIGGWFDIAVWRSVQGHPQLIWAGYWDKNWQLPKAATEAGRGGPGN